jgi:hypothetical protein
LLQEEIDDLEKAIRHIEHVIRGAETLDQVMVSRVLIMVASRAHSLPNLLKAA